MIDTKKSPSKGEALPKKSVGLLVHVESKVLRLPEPSNSNSWLLLLGDGEGERDPFRWERFWARRLPVHILLAAVLESGWLCCLLPRCGARESHPPGGSWGC